MSHDWTEEVERAFGKPVGELVENQRRIKIHLDSETTRADNAERRVAKLEKVLVALVEGFVVDV